MAISRTKAAEIAKKHGLGLGDLKQLMESETEKDAEDLAEMFAPAEPQEDMDALVKKIMGR